MAGNIERTLALIDAAWNEGKLGVIAELVTDDFVHIDPNVEGVSEGLEGYQETISMFRKGFPDLVIDIEEMIDAGDQVTVRWIARGTHRGKLLNLTPTSRRVSLRGASVVRFADDGRIAISWAHWDPVALMQKLTAAYKDADTDPNDGRYMRKEILAS